MAKNKDKQPKPPTGFWIAAAKIFETVVDKFGWPGVLLLFVMYLIVYRASDEQVHNIIDMYILGRGIGAMYPLIFMGALFTTVVLAQRYVYKKKIKFMAHELDRIGSEKSGKQEQALGVPLHHSTLPEGSR